MRTFTPTQSAILRGEVPGGFAAYLMVLYHPDGPVRAWSGASNWTDGEGNEWIGASSLLEVGDTFTRAGLDGAGTTVVWPMATPALVALARDGRVAGCRFTLSRALFQAGNAMVGDPILDLDGMAEQPEIIADPKKPRVILTVEDVAVTLTRPRPVRQTPAELVRWFGDGDGRDTGFDFVADLQDAKPF